MTLFLSLADILVIAQIYLKCKTGVQMIIFKLEFKSFITLRQQWKQDMFSD